MRVAPADYTPLLPTIVNLPKSYPALAPVYPVSIWYDCARGEVILSASILLSGLALFVFGAYLFYRLFEADRFKPWAFCSAALCVWIGLLVSVFGFFDFTSRWK